MNSLKTSFSPHQQLHPKGGTSVTNLRSPRAQARSHKKGDMEWWEIVVRSRFYQMFLNSLSQSYIFNDWLLYCLKAKMAFWVIRNKVSWNFNKRNGHYRFCKWLHWCSGGCFETVVGTFAYFNIADRIFAAIIDATILFQKLSALGFKASALVWIISFMSGRCQKWLDIEHKSQFEVSTDMCTLSI